MIRKLLTALGKSERKVIAVFASDRIDAASAVDHVRKGAPDLPVRVYINNPPFEALRQLWPEWVALSVAAWTGKPGHRLLKLLPFLIPPFRILVMNEQGDFFPATPVNVLHHAGRRILNALLSVWRRLADVALGAALWFFAKIAQRFNPFSRWLFSRYHGDRPLFLPSPALEGEGVEVIRHPSRQWKIDDVRERIYESGARYLLFLEGHAVEPDLASWLPLFQDPRTFAVSRQCDYLDWKPSLFPTAAFRPLQPGEAALTLAPVSSAILVDRGKLGTVGVPRTIVPGTAWLQVFWLASAAGWRSYHIGDGQPVREASDWPYEEAEFVSRILRDPVLRQFGPREADLARGNVAFERHLPFRGFPRVMILSPYLPFPLSHGGAVRIYNLCRALAPATDFILVAFREKNERVHYDELLQVFRRVYTVDINERESPDSSLPRQVRQHQSRGLRAWLAELASELRADILQIEFTHLAHFRDAVRIPSLLVEHDLTFTLYRQIAEQKNSPEARREYERWLAFERNALTSHDVIWTMSGQDRDRAIAEGSPAERTQVVENGVDLDRFQPAPPAAGQEIFYIGSFRHLPNILGFERLVNEIMPRVWARHPNARLRVVAGPEPEKYWKRPSQLDPRIELHAFVEDVRPLYAKASVVAVPLVISAGTNVKVIEAMACSRAVVTTPIGCTGLELADGVDAVIRDTSETFAAAIVQLLDDEPLRLKIAAAARRTVEERFSWTAIARSAQASYQTLLRRA